MGRPSSFTQEVADKILAELPDNDGGLEAICERDDMPSTTTVYRWLQVSESFREAYVHARVVCGHVQAQRALRDALEAKDAALGRLAYDARKWTASKLAPKVYGDKQEIAHTGQVSIQAVPQDERI